MNEIIDFVMRKTGSDSELMALAFVIVCSLLVLLTISGLVISIFLAIKYAKFNRKKNSTGITGEQAARKILDMHGLQRIKVSAMGSIAFGNSYSRLFKKVRLRRLTYKKDSITSLAMAAQKSSLAVLDAEADPDMRMRNRMMPIITFGPYLFIPLIVVGILLDLAKAAANAGLYTVLFAGIGLAFYTLSFILAMVVLRVEKKGQERAYVILRDNNMATEEELTDIRTLFKLYNIQYVNDMILALLELIYRVLQVLAKKESGSSSK